MNAVDTITVRGERATQLKQLAAINDIPATVVLRKMCGALLHGTPKIPASELQAALGLTDVKIFQSHQTN